jgi:hypothetical protein
MLFGNKNSQNFVNMRIQKKFHVTTISPCPRPTSCLQFYTGINIIELFSRRSSTEIEALLAEH